MWLYYFALIVIFVLFVYGLILFSLKSGNRAIKEHINWFADHKIKISVFATVLFIASNMAFYIPIKKAISCSYKGYEHAVETKYWMFSGNCNYKGKNGEWIPIWKLVGIAEGDGSSNDDNATIR